MEPNPPVIAAVLRLDLGLGNANHAAAWLGFGGCLLWLVALAWPKLSFAVSISTVGVFIAIGLTQSRGGMLGFAMGIAAVIYGLKETVRLRDVMLFLAGALAMIAVGLLLRFGPNVIKKDDQSAITRLEVYRTVPAMMHDSRGGWKDAAEAYHQWYQPVGKIVDLKNLLSAHWTALVGWSDWQRLLYGLLWIAALTVSWPRSSAPTAPLFGAIVNLGVAGLFTGLGDIRLLLTAVFACALAAAWMCARRRSLPTLTSALGAAAIVTLPYILLCTQGKGTEPRICDDGEAISVGKNPSLLLYCPDRSVLGSRYGQDLRREKIDAVITEGSLSHAVDTLVLSGASVPDVNMLNLFPKIFIFNPSFLPDDLLPFVSKDAKVYAVFGEHYSNPSAMAWHLSKDPRISNMDAFGQGAYLPQWLSFLKTDKPL